MEYPSIYPQLQVSPNADRAKNTILFFRINVLIILLTIVINISTMLSIQDGQVSVMAGIVALGFSVLTFIPYILLIVFFIMWMRRAYNNLHRAGLKDLAYTEGWSVTGWFIPFANFVIPFRIVKEIWNETQQAFYKEPITEIDEDKSVNYWWGCYIISGIIAVIASFFLQSHQLEIGYFSAIVSNIFSLLAAIYGAKMVRDISGYENEMLKRAQEIYETDLANAAQQYLASSKNPVAANAPYNDNLSVLDEENELSGEYVENAERAKFLNYGLYILIFFAFAYGAMSFYIFSESNITNYYEIAGAANRWFNNIILAGLLVFIVTGIIAMLWMRRAYSNLHTLGIKRLAFKTPMAIYGWFIPIGNLFIPYSILRDINRYSQEALYEKETVITVRPIANTVLLLFFWILFLLSGMFFMSPIFYADMAGGISFDEIIKDAIFGMMGSITGIVAFYLGIIIIKNISKTESDLFAKIEKRFGNQENPEIPNDFHNSSDPNPPIQ